MAVRRKPAPRPKPFTPYRPPSPPAGSYDPALDAQRLAAARGLADLTQDVETQGTRATVDYGLGREQTLRQAGYGQQDLDRERGQSLADLNLQRGRGLEDLSTGRGRSMDDLYRQLGRGATDLGTARTRGTEDYNRNIEMLTRNYRQLGEAQQQQQNAAGVLRGGAALQAANKRAENEAIERQPIDTGYNRFLADNTLSNQRLGEDYTTQTGRVNEDFTRGQGRLNEDYQRGSYLTNEGYDTQTGRLGNETQWNLGQLGLGLQRSSEDQGTQLTRARRENAAFGLDIGVQQAYQAAGSGWVPPQRPRNESILGGRPVRTIRQGNQLIDYDQTGRVVRRRRA